MRKLLQFILAALLFTAQAHAQILSPILFAKRNPTARMVTIAGGGMWVPSTTEQSPIVGDAAGNIGSIISANASSAMVFMGSVHQYGTNGCFTGTKNLQAVWFRSGGITNGGTPGTLKFSIQGISTVAGSPAQNDNTILGGGNAFSTAAINTISAGTWQASPTFSSPAVVSCGQAISFVVGWSSAGVGSSFQLIGTNGMHANGWAGTNLATTTNGSAYTGPTNPPSTPNVMLQFSDGTFGAFLGETPFATIGNTGNYNSGSNPNEWGCTFSLPFRATVSGMATYTGFGAGTPTWTVELTDDLATPTILASVAVDGHWQHQAGNNTGYGFLTFAPVTLAANTTYHIGSLATSATNIIGQEFNIGTNSQFQSGPMGANFTEASRHGGAWTNTSTVWRPGCQIFITQVFSG